MKPVRITRQPIVPVSFYMHALGFLDPVDHLKKALAENRKYQEQGFTIQFPRRIGQSSYTLAQALKYAADGKNVAIVVPFKTHHMNDRVAEAVAKLNMEAPKGLGEGSIVVITPEEIKSHHQWRPLLFDMQQEPYGLEPANHARPLTQNAIEASEAIAQDSLVKSDLFPLHTSNGKLPDKWLNNITTDMGLEFSPAEDDSLFHHVKLPKDWYRKACLDSSFWSYICDEHNRVRVKIFYKGSAHDRKAHFEVAPCYRFEISEAGNNLGSTALKMFEYGAEARTVFWQTREMANQAGKDWVEGKNGPHYPYWPNPQN